MTMRLQNILIKERKEYILERINLALNMYGDNCKFEVELDEDFNIKDLKEALKKNNSKHYTDYNVDKIIEPITISITKKNYIEYVKGLLMLKKHFSMLLKDAIDSKIGFCIEITQEGFKKFFFKNSQYLIDTIMTISHDKNLLIECYMIKDDGKNNIEFAITYKGEQPLLMIHGGLDEGL